MQNELKEAFRMYDKEGKWTWHLKCKWIITMMWTGNGYITTQVLREILAALDDKLTSEDLDEMISEIDTDGSGTVDFEGSFN